MKHDKIGEMFETGDRYDLNAVCNGIYAVDEPVDVSEDYPSGYRSYVKVSVGSLPPRTRCVFMGPFPTFPKREDVESVEVLHAKKVLLAEGYKIERPKEG
jgi:hypothetical protein